MSKNSLYYESPKFVGDASIDFSRETTVDDDIEVQFEHLESAIIKCISKFDAVFGCVAWLTNKKILESLVGKQVSIIVNKEDFLRPDVGDRKFFKPKLRKRYEALRCDIDRMDFEDILGRMSTHQCQSVAPIRCCGVMSKNPFRPRMHNKFLVFCHLAHDREARKCIIEPQQVWTGSYNLSEAANDSFENAVLIKRATIARAYFYEFQRIAALAEPLDWTSKCVTPEYVVGSG